MSEIAQFPPNSDDDGVMSVVEGELAVRELNRKHAIVSEGNRVVVLAETIDRETQRRVINRFSSADFQLLYRNRFVRVGKTTVTLGKFWLDSHLRRQYEALVFDPSHDHGGDVYNLWQGFSMTPKKGNWSLIRKHLLEVGSNGDEATFEFILDWLAWLFQHPESQAETSIVWKGEQGSGKGTIARAVGRMIGQHFLHVSSTRHLVGNFNAHLQDALFLFADEAFWAGDKASEGVLKAMITEPTLVIERKGRDVVVMPNRLHIAIATNNEWAVPVGIGDRRFCIVDVPGTYIGDEPYFRALYDEMNNGGLEAFMFHLVVQRSIVNGRPPKPPTSATAVAAKFDQKLRTMSPVEKWIYEMLDSGHTLRSGSSWLASLPKADLYKDYVAYMDQQNVTRRSDETAIGMAFAKAIPSIRIRRVRVPGTLEGRDRHYIFPPLEVCRSEFAKMVSIPNLWAGDEIDES